MAKQVSDMPGDLRRAGCKYPWDEWLNGEPWLLVPGEDFTTDVAAFRSACHRAGGARRLKVVTTLRPEGLYIQAIPRDGGTGSS